MAKWPEARVISSRNPRLTRESRRPPAHRGTYALLADMLLAKAGDPARAARVREIRLLRSSSVVSPFVRGRVARAAPSTRFARRRGIATARVASRAKPVANLPPHSRAENNAAILARAVPETAAR